MFMATVLATSQFDGAGKAFVQHRIVEDQIGARVNFSPRK
jgi:hypothetical protein